jgi:hypothetical protein
MQASLKVRPDMPANEEKFGDLFFRRFTQRNAPEPLALEDGIAKAYPFPTFYGDVGCAIGIFMCDWAAALAMMPHPSIRPVRMTGGRSLVIFSCYEYRQVLRVWPYNEIAMMIPVMANAGFSPPVLPMLASGLFPRFGYYVFAMPVTSRENQLRGNKLWGLPKVTQAIDVDASGEDCVTVARESDGAAWFTLRVPKAGVATDFDVRSHLYSKLDGKILKSQTCFKGSFNVTKHLRALWKKGLAPDREYLTIGAGPSAQPLRDLGIEPHPFQFRYTPSMNAAFDLPIAGFEVDQ